MRYSLIAVALVATSGIARADRPIRLGAAKGIDRAAVEAALDTAFRTMTPCFRTATGR